MPFIGFYAGFFGAAHGTFTLMLLTSGGIGLLESAAITRVVGFMVAVVATLSFLSAGLIQWPEGIALAVGLTTGGLLGARFSLKRGTIFVRWLLIVVTSLSALQLFWKAFSA